ncbi:hypothetical protein [Endozoicomonas sp. ALB032]|uniref:hypothetical protein n=1 Tax=Endozoicomonas sp. ALB032 TaxID=3403082 RepID=UPI003BB6E928
MYTSIGLTPQTFEHILDCPEHFNPEKWKATNKQISSDRRAATAMIEHEELKPFVEALPDIEDRVNSGIQFFDRVEITHPELSKKLFWIDAYTRLDLKKVDMCELAFILSGITNGKIHTWLRHKPERVDHTLYLISLFRGVNCVE